MAATGASLPAAAASFSAGNRRIGTFPVRPVPALSPAGSSSEASGSGYGIFEKTPKDSNGTYLRGNPKHMNVEEDEADSVKGSAKDYFEEAKVLIRSDGGPPRWFSPMECSGGGKRLNNAPSLLYLPGIDGVGLGLTRHHQRLGKMFDVWCLHIPVMDRTPFADMVKLVENTVKLEYSRSPGRPVYLVGESLGGCLAMVIAARNPDIDLVLIFANPATSFNKSQIQGLTPLLGSTLGNPFLRIPYLLSLIIGKEILDSPAVEDLSTGLVELSSNSQVIANILPGGTLLWKMKLLKLGASNANSRLHAIIAQTLILSSGKDPLFPSQEEGERLRHLIPQCEIRKFNDKGHFLFLEDGFDIVAAIKGAGFYRRGRNHNFIADYLPPTLSECRRLIEQFRWFDVATSPVIFSTSENGQIVRGLSGYPSKGPAILVGNHMIMGVEINPMLGRIFDEKKIIVRGMAHPIMFTKPGEVKLPDSSIFDAHRLVGAVPVSGTNMFKLLASNSHILLYPGGAREIFHRKGEEYQLFWPEQSDFVGLAARFGATFVPFGAVGEDDTCELILDYDDFIRVPYLKKLLEDINSKLRNPRMGMPGEVGNQPVHLPGAIPKLPGRLYLLFGKPIKTQGRKQELKDKQKAQELYLHVKSQVESCIAYLKEEREQDPYRHIFPRTLYQVANGFTSEIPTFEP